MDGKHATTGKVIGPLAPAFNAERFTDATKAEKWFRRNCNDVAGRECTVGEKTNDQEIAAVRRTLIETQGVRSVHDIRTCKMGDMIVVDAHLEVDATISVEEDHDIAVIARQRVLQRHRAFNLMTHVDPWRRPELDHAATGSSPTQ